MYWADSTAQNFNCLSHFSITNLLFAMLHAKQKELKEKSCISASAKVQQSNAKPYLTFG